VSADVEEAVAEEGGARDRGSVATSTRRRPLMLLLLALVVIFLFVEVWKPKVDPRKVKAAIVGAGPLGVLLYVGGFCGFELFHLPAILWICVGAWCWGPIQGWFAAVATAPLAISCPFWLIRRVGGNALAEIQSPLIRRVLAKLDERPILTIFLLRFFLFFAPPVTTALALSNVSYRDFIVGSALGLVVPITTCTYFFDRVLAAWEHS